MELRMTWQEAEPCVDRQPRENEPPTGLGTGTGESPGLGTEPDRTRPRLATYPADQEGSDSYAGVSVT